MGSCSGHIRVYFYVEVWSDYSDSISGRKRVSGRINEYKSMPAIVGTTWIRWNFELDLGQRTLFSFGH